jgi:hypothetical protein
MNTSTTTSSELLLRSHDAVDGLSLDVRAAVSAQDRSDHFSDFSACVAMHIGCLRWIVMPALASSTSSDTPALVLENLAAVERALHKAAEAPANSNEFNTRFQQLAGHLRLQFELEARLLFPLLLAGREGARVPLAQSMEIYGARLAVEAARDVNWFQRGLR